ncbi:MAG: non-homologous end-joining DNA ligase [Candidatus Babeliaceae bacterium]
MQPTFIKPMLATLTDDYFSRNDWLYEPKFDGERCLAFKKNGKVRLCSRNNKNMNLTYPELVTALEKQHADNFIIDGEIVSLNAAGVSDFQLLQGRINVHELEKIKIKQQEVVIAYCIFDLMYVDGHSICTMPLHARKKILKKLFTYNKILVYTEHTVGGGVAFFKKACALHWEGIIAKRADSRYVTARSRDWLKFKCSMEQELVIVGYTKPKGARKYFGALLVGYYQKNILVYAGKVGTGYSQEVLEMLGKKLHKLEVKTCPLAQFDESEKDVHWVRPVLVAEFKFAQWTSGGKLRVGRYKGLRDDKAAKDVVKETSQPIGPVKK